MHLPAATARVFDPSDLMADRTRPTRTSDETGKSIENVGGISRGDIVRNPKSRMFGSCSAL